MNESTASLDRLHDIVLPPPVPWWPPAPGWYVLGALGLLLGLMLIFRSWRHWRRNAYRREALRLLASAPDAVAIATLLRRTALESTPRREIATLTGSAWVDWLAKESPEPIPAALRQLLTSGIYATDSPVDLSPLRAWVAHWINKYDSPPKDS